MKPEFRVPQYSVSTVIIEFRLAEPNARGDTKVSVAIFAGSDADLLVSKLNHAFTVLDKEYTLVMVPKSA